jgi:hypothetical protein
MPQKAGEAYHVIAMEWFDQWKKYTDFDHIEETPGDDSDTKMTDEFSNKL